MVRLTGEDAIRYAENTGGTLSKYNDPVEAAREGLSVAEAREVAAEDGGLVYCDVLVRTSAERVAAQLAEDGQRFTTSAGRTLLELAADLGGVTTWRDGWHVGDTYRIDFADGSALTVAGEAWDYGFAGCFCWEGAGHADECGVVTATDAGLVLVRSDAGDGGWSLHAPGATDDAIADGSASAIVSGPATWDNEAGEWDRPDSSDYAAAWAAFGRGQEAHHG